jgi:hypothetical protein
MTMRLSTAQLLAAFAERKPITINGENFSVINKLEHEDGSGHSFNVTGYVGGKEAKAYVRCDPTVALFISQSQLLFVNLDAARAIMLDLEKKQVRATAEEVMVRPPAATTLVKFKK